jgi:hypothetical protein
MKKMMVIALLSMMSSWVLAVEEPLTLETKVLGDVTAGQAVLASTALVAGAVAASNSGGSSNGGTTGTAGTTGTTGTSN